MNYYRELEHGIRAQYPHVPISARTYDVGAARTWAARSLWLAFAMFVLLLNTHERVFGSLGVPAPDFLVWASSNMTTAILLGFVVVQLASKPLTTSGAFEVYFDGELVHSKLDSGKPPSLEMLLSILSGHVPVEHHQRYPGATS